MKYADLHIHTNLSDGTFTPEDVIKQADEFNLSCIAITDHDTVSAIEPTIKLASRFNIEVVPGVELSAEIDNYEIHILGYFVDWQAKWFQEKLVQICDIRKKRALTIIDKLRTHNINLDPDEFLRSAAGGAIGRLHIAKMMQAEGFVSSINEAFNKYIGNGRPCYVKKYKLTPAEAIKMIKRLGGVAVLAHPYSIDDSEKLIAELVQSGLKGIEAYYPDHDQATTEHYRSLAQKYGLLITGGSDSHGLGKHKVMIGAVKIPYSLVEALKQEAKVAKSEQD